MKVHVAKKLFAIFVVVVVAKTTASWEGFDMGVPAQREKKNLFHFSEHFHHHIQPMAANRLPPLENMSTNSSPSRKAIRDAKLNTIKQVHSASAIQARFRGILIRKRMAIVLSCTTMNAQEKKAAVRALGVGVSTTNKNMKVAVTTAENGNKGKPNTQLKTVAGTGNANEEKNKVTIIQPTDSPPPPTVNTTTRCGPGCCCRGLSTCVQCTPFPETDDGVPPPCRISPLCPLNQGFCVNHLYIAKAFGRCGLKSMDQNRKLLFGIAAWTTLPCAFVLGIWGCLALTTDAAVVQRAYWIGARVTDQTNGKNYAMYVGLRSFEYVDCSFVPGWDSYNTGCTRQKILFTDTACTDGPFATACQACQDNAKTMWTTAFFGCGGLILAWLGQHTRMRACADTPVQKLLGVFTEVNGVLSTAVAMFKFNTECKANLNDALTASKFVGTYSLGPGFICFM